MTPALGILCYHRISDDGEEDTAWPYLERGTAVRTKTFQAQIEDIARFADIVGEKVVLDILGGRRELDRPAAWLTFDDGYTDVKRVVPYVETGTVFVTTSATEQALPADAWYAVLLSATCARGAIDLGLGSFDYDLSHRAGRARLVDGPERRAYIRASSEQQKATLQQLAWQLGAVHPPCGPYLDDTELRTLLGSGWSIGSHGVTHRPFDSIDDQEVRREAAASRDALRALGASVRTLALPDGARAHLGELANVGYECVLGLGDAAAIVGAAVQARYLVPDDPRWVARVLRPVLTGAAKGVARG